MTRRRLRGPEIAGNAMSRDIQTHQFRAGAGNSGISGSFHNISRLKFYRVLIGRYDLVFCEYCLYSVSLVSIALILTAPQRRTSHASPAYHATSLRHHAIPLSHPPLQRLDFFFHLCLSVPSLGEGRHLLYREQPSVGER